MSDNSDDEDNENDDYIKLSSLDQTDLVAIILFLMLHNLEFS